MLKNQVAAMYVSFIEEGVKFLAVDHIPIKRDHVTPQLKLKYYLLILNQSYKLLNNILISNVFTSVFLMCVYVV